MKRISIIGLVLLFSGTAALAQGELDAQSPIFFRNEKSLSLILGTRGLGVNGRYADRITARRKTIYDADILSFKARKEYKVKGAYYSTRSFVFGKTNSFFVIQGGYGKQYEMFRKWDKGGISIRRFWSVGPAIGFLKPIYYEVADINNPDVPIETVKFDKNLHVSPPAFIGRASFFKGFNELSIVPGACGKFGLMFEYSSNDISLHAMEAGVMIDVFPERIPIMATEENDFLFLGMFVSYRFGKIFDKRGIIDEDDLTY